MVSYFYAINCGFLIFYNKLFWFNTHLSLYLQQKFPTVSDLVFKDFKKGGYNANVFTTDCGKRTVFISITPMVSQWQLIFFIVDGSTPVLLNYFEAIHYIYWIKNPNLGPIDPNISKTKTNNTKLITDKINQSMYNLYLCTQAEYVSNKLSNVSSETKCDRKKRKANTTFKIEWTKPPS